MAKSKVASPSKTTTTTVDRTKTTTPTQLSKNNDTKKKNLSKSPSFDEFRKLLHDDSTCNDNDSSSSNSTDCSTISTSIVEEEETKLNGTNYNSSMNGTSKKYDTNGMKMIQQVSKTTTHKKQHKKKDYQLSSTTTTTKPSVLLSLVFKILKKLISIFILYFPLIVCFVLLVVCYFIKNIYTVYYIPLMIRSERTNRQLQSEYTYYNRLCTKSDISTFNINDIMLPISTTTVVQQEDTNLTISMIQNNSKSSSKSSSSSSSSSSSKQQEEDNQNDDDTIVQHGQKVMLQHGSVIIPNIVSNISLLQELRNYIEYKNSIINDIDTYPVSQGYQRISYGIDASEHIIVSQFLQSLFIDPNNNTKEETILKKILSNLLGDDNPSIAEITVITSKVNAPAQAWHMDTKINGNAVQYSRTYSHSYSLFIPLQNTTQTMGSTDICPGTHMCHNDLSNICEQYKLGIHLVSSNSSTTGSTSNSSSTIKKDTNNDDYFPIGSAILLNQHVWHRGGHHTDPTIGNDRIVFIISFIARPKFYISSSLSSIIGLSSSTSSSISSTTTTIPIISDQRQLSRGTYFHQKWNMWGHTIQDIINNPLITMIQPWSTLKCLGLYTSPSSTNNNNWGYDLLTATYMRYMNGQLEDDDIETRLLIKMNMFYFPKWLQGSIIKYDIDNYTYYSQSYTWITFLQQTGTKTYQFIIQLSISIHIIWFCTIIVISTRSATTSLQRCKYIFSNILQLILLYCIILGIAYKVWNTIYVSSWGSNIRNGLALRRPFPKITSFRQNLFIDGSNSKDSSQEQQQQTSLSMISIGKTTFPTRNDILIGTRFDAQFLGSYNHWLSNHPGNVNLYTIIQSYIPLLLFLKEQQQQQQQQYADNNHLDENENNNNNNTSNKMTTLKHSQDFFYMQQHIAKAIAVQIQNQYDTPSRFLQQDYRTGDWRIMTTLETLYCVQEMMIVLSYSYSSSTTTTTNRQHLPIIHESIRYMIASWRYDSIYRSTYLSFITQYMLWQLKQSILHLSTTSYIDTAATVTRDNFITKSVNTGTNKKSSIFATSSQSISLIGKGRTTRNTILPWFQRSSAYPVKMMSQSLDDADISSSQPSINSDIADKIHPTLFKVGSIVWTFDDESELYYSGIITNTNVTKMYHNQKNFLHRDWSYTVEYDDGTIQDNVSHHTIQKQLPIIEGTAVFGCFHSSDNNDNDYDEEWYNVPWNDCYPGRIVRVMPNGSVQILFDDGDTYTIKRHRYYIPPFEYSIPFNDVE